MIRIKDIAIEANVSEGTVDRVIHNRGGVSKKTEEKIKKILKKRNFTLNPVASALAMQKKYKVAVLIPDFNDRDIFWKSPYLGILRALEDIESLGIQAEIFHFNQYDRKSYKKAFDALLKTNPSAVIFVPMFLKETSIIVNELKHLNIKFMFLNIDLDSFENSIYIGQDSYKAGFIAGKLMHLCILNKPKVLIVQSENNVGDNNAIAKRIEGFDTFFSSINNPVDIVYLNLENLNDVKSCHQKLNQFLKENTDVNGLFIPSSRTANIMECLSKEQINHLKIVGFDNTPQNIECLKNGDVSFLISQKPFDQGYEAIRIMKDFLLKNKEPEKKIYLPIDILLKENIMENEIDQWMEDHEKLYVN
ncbi:substrate-binding domain-containing protein [Gaetbulibacter sp. M240]|uniref:substrate-binding domain-containing protein n=1 Tax=Gaetbulibacter sp. M240 TaxID=3126511 RepID=UPI00374F67F6